MSAPIWVRDLGMVEHGRSRTAVLLAAVFLVSLGFLGLQLTLTRLLSAVLSHHYVFVVVSLALLGLGVGGLLTHVVQVRLRADTCGYALLSLYGATAALTVVIAIGGIIAMAHLPYFYTHALWYFAVAFLPFLAAGMFFAELYRRFPQLAGRVYGTDLIGAACGSVLAVAVLARWGGIGGSFLLAVLVALGASLLAIWADSWRRLAVGSSMLVLALTVLPTVLYVGGVGTADIPRSLNPDKEIYDAIHGPWRGEVTDVRWSAFGRTELVSYRGNPEHRDIYIDGTAGTPMYRFSGNFDEPGEAVERLYAEFPGAFPLRFMAPEQRGRALIIGPGGGRDVLLAAGAGFAEITAVEVNPDLLQLVRAQADYNGGLYTAFDRIRVEQAEGRHFIKRDRSRYDLIMMSLPVTNTSRSREGFALTESFLLTEEAIGDYLDHLTVHGQLLVIAHDELAVVRLLRLALDAMAMRGMPTTAAMQHIYVLGSFPYPVVVVGNKPIGAPLAARLLREIHLAGYSARASYVPHIDRPGAVNPMLQALGQGRLDLAAVENIVAGYGYDISRVSDNRPFFYKTEPGLPEPISTLFYSALIIALLVIVYPLMRGFSDTRTGWLPRTRLLWNLLLFAILGFGFMLIEMALIQRLTFFLGDPVMALAVLLFTVLVFMGLGSLSSGKIAPTHLRRVIGFVGVAIAAMTLAYALFMPSLLDWLLPMGLGSRIASAILLTGPLAYLLGLPFPLALQALQTTDAAQGIPWMWAVNGVFSVLGAASSAIIAMLAGLDEILLTAACSYLLLGLTALWGKATRWAKEL